MTPYLSRSVGALAILIAFMSASDCQAQARRYQPARPTVSPYVNLFRGNAGVVPNYYSLVRPQLYQQSFNEQQSIQQTQQNAALKYLANQPTAALTETGKGSWFMSYRRQSFGGGGGAGQAFGGAAGR